MKRVTFAGDGLEVIGQYAFTGSGLESFTAPSSLKRIGESAFCNCKDLRHLDLGACQLQIDDKVADRGGSWLANIIDVSNLESVVLPPTF